MFIIIGVETDGQVRWVQGSNFIVIDVNIDDGRVQWVHGTNEQHLTPLEQAAFDAFYIKYKSYKRYADQSNPDLPTVAPGAAKPQNMVQAVVQAFYAKYESYKTAVAQRLTKRITGSQPSHPAIPVVSPDRYSHDGVRH